MKFAIQHAVGDPKWTPAILAPAAVTEFARSSEEAGFAALAFTDHPAPSAAWVDSGGEGVADPFTSLGFCAAVTTRIRLLTFVLVAAYRNPYLAAHQLATLDQLSAGRVTVGLGTGYLFGEFRALGVEPSERLHAFDDAVDVMRRAWTGSEIGSKTRCLPPVVQVPHPPLWIHGNSRFGVERAARYADGWLGMMTHGNEVMARTTRTAPLVDFDAVARRIDDVRDAAKAAGRDADAIELAVAGVWPMLDVRRGWDVDRCLADVASLESLGVGWIVSTCCGDDPAASHDTVRHFGAAVVDGTKRT
jgi:probable F420-dependent oxidoreductase